MKNDNAAWEVTGVAYFRVPEKGSDDYYVIGLQFFGEAGMKQAYRFAKGRGWLPFQGGASLNLIPPNSNSQNNGSGACPDHGHVKMKRDKRGRGKYCAFKNMKGEFCGWQDWK